MLSLNDVYYVQIGDVSHFKTAINGQTCFTVNTSIGVMQFECLNIDIYEQWLNKFQERYIAVENLVTSACFRNQFISPISYYSPKSTLFDFTDENTIVNDESIVNENDNETLNNDNNDDNQTKQTTMIHLK